MFSKMRGVAVPFDYGHELVKTVVLPHRRVWSQIGAHLTYHRRNKSQALPVHGHNRIKVIDSSGNQEPDNNDA